MSKNKEYITIEREDYEFLLRMTSERHLPDRWTVRHENWSRYKEIKEKYSKNVNYEIRSNIIKEIKRIISYGNAFDNVLLISDLIKKEELKNDI